MPTLLGQLLHQLTPHYDYLYATVHRFNERSHRFHLRQGYRLVAADAERLHLLKPIVSSQSPYLLPQGLSVRLGIPADAEAAHMLNKQWMRALRADLANGFLTTVYSVAEFQILCAAGEVAVLLQENEMIT